MYSPLDLHTTSWTNRAASFEQQITESQRILSTAYNPDTHQLQYVRTPAQLPGNRGTETVTVDMLTGIETVTASGENGTVRITVKTHAGDANYTTVVTDLTNPNKILQIEGFDANGKYTIRQFHYNAEGKLAVARIHLGNVVNVTPLRSIEVSVA